MKRVVEVSLFLSICLATSCARVQGSEERSDALTGTWVGDFGPAFYDRNTISLELHWDGKELTGMIHRLAIEANRLADRQSSDREKIELWVENQMLRFERRLPPARSDQKILQKTEPEFTVRGQYQDSQSALNE